MKKLIVSGFLLALAGGCTQLAVSKLQSDDEAQWRAALAEIQKDDVNFLNLNNETPMSGPEKLGYIAMNKVIGRPFEDMSYPLHVRKAAIDALGDMLTSDAVFKYKGYKGYKISKVAFDQLKGIYAKVKEDEIRKEVVKVFDNPRGYQCLLDTGVDDERVANMLAACSDNQYSFLFDYYCKGEKRRHKICQRHLHLNLLKREFIKIMPLVERPKKQGERI